MIVRGRKATLKTSVEDQVNRRITVGKVLLEIGTTSPETKKFLCRSRHVQRSIVNTYKPVK